MTPQLMTALRFYARNHVRYAMREQLGIKARYVEAREITIAAEQWLSDHWREVLPEAQALCAKIESGAQKRKAVRSKASVVQNSSAKVEADQC